MNSLCRIAHPTWLTQLCKLSKNIGQCETLFYSSESNWAKRYSTKSLGKKSDEKPLDRVEPLHGEAIDDTCSSAFVKIDEKLINHLERTSLVDFQNEEALTRLQEAVHFAETLFEVDTSGVEPLTSVLENESLYLREDKVFPTKREDILVNAVLTEEDYFVAPPGNIPLEPQSKIFVKDEKSN